MCACCPDVAAIELEQVRLIREYLAAYRPSAVVPWPTADVVLLRHIVDERDYHTGRLTPRKRGGISAMPRATYADVRDRAAREVA